MKINLLAMHNTLCNLLPVGYEVYFRFTLEYEDVIITFTYPQKEDLQWRVSIQELEAQRFPEDYFESVVNNVVLKEET